MAFATLTPTALIWKNLGFHYLLADRDSNFASSQKPAGTERREQPQTARVARPAFAARQTNRASEEAETSQPRWTPEKPEQWPSVWREQFALAKKGIVAWSYWALGEDLAAGRNKSSQPDEERAKRSNFFKKIFRDLAYPAGTHTFWPPTVPRSCVSPEAAKNIFWSALAHLGSRGVVIMGSAAAKPLVNSARLKPLTMMRQNGQFVWILWEINTLADSPELYQRVLTFLRGSFKQFLHR